MFANLVAAYDGSAAERSRKAFGSLLIVMVTTLVTMIVVGPAIFDLADPMRQDVSVFTQTMDRLLPAPIAYAGTLIGIIVLLSAAAASAQGLQNLTLGMRHRHYVPARFGERNRFDVADQPVTGQVLVVAVCFIAFGTHEETYLALYAAGVFVLLGLTGWASVKRLARERAAQKTSVLTIAGTVLAALVTSGAAVLIFVERFLDGAWAYLVLVPVFIAVFSHFRRRLGAPRSIDDRLGRIVSGQKSFLPTASSAWPHAVLAVLDGVQSSEAAAIGATHLARKFVVPWGIAMIGPSVDRADAYRSVLQSALLPERGVRTCDDEVAVAAHAAAGGFDLLVAARNLPGARELARACNKPLLIVHGDASAGNRYPEFARVIVGLDGSLDAEAVLPIVMTFMKSGAKAILVAVPDGDPSLEMLQAYVARVADVLKGHGEVEVHVGGSGPARTLVQKAAEDPADLVIVASHGGGGRHRFPHVQLGSVPERLFVELNCSMLVIPVSPDMEAALLPPTAQTTGMSSSA